ncbi:PadR family transcriptional regulator [Clostridium sp. 19966]|uniref:PadR family transcriptional regulator n=1 Tax=Clostridium sp. 19966 TaxID=2768166 RepID=UPI0028DF404D|nr:PadR family transcriptional regulator [Clostridium sp. 19966]MDT8717146.1 PadR family transcriptional regulator [Clostridium sp. 19966]
MNSKSQFLKGTLEGCILKIINDEEIYAYQIAEKLKDLGLEDISEGTIYPLILRLEKDNLLTSVKRESPLGPKRKYYSLTERGKEDLNEFYSNWQILKKSVDNIFSDYMKKEV